MEWGSVADWFSGIVTAVGIIVSLNLSLNKNKFKFDINTKGNGYELLYSIVNRSGFDIEAQMVALSFRTNKFKKSEFNMFMEHKLYNYISLKNNKLHQDTFQLASIVESEHEIRKYNNGEIPFEMRRFNFDTKRFKDHKKFYVVVEILAQDGRIYRSQAKKFRLEDITYIKKTEI